MLLDDGEAVRATAVAYKEVEATDASLLCSTGVHCRHVFTVACSVACSLQALCAYGQLLCSLRKLESSRVGKKSCCLDLHVISHLSGASSVPVVSCAKRGATCHRAFTEPRRASAASATQTLCAALHRVWSKS